MIVLRDYQQAIVDKSRASYLRGCRAPLCVAPTASGKTVMFSYIAQRANEQGRRVAILVHRHELLMQTSRTLDQFNVPHGLVSPRFTPSKNQIQVASVQTLARRDIGELDLIVIDEAHHAVSQTWRKIIDSQPRARLLGVTATPWRLSGEGLGTKAGGYFDDLIMGPSLRELIGRGFLSEYDLYVPPTQLDMVGVPKRAGDFARKETEERVDRPTITGSAVEHYRNFSPWEPAVVFCVSISHAEHVAQEFRAQGFKFECIHGKLDDARRTRLINGLADGSIHGLTSSDLISEGTDIPCITTAILLRPTSSLSLYLQQVGRSLRKHPKKSRAIILDHCGNVFTHGLPDEDRAWDLDGEKRSGRKMADDQIRARMCEKCYAAYVPTRRECPYCGHERALGPGGRVIEEKSGELKKITEEDRARIAAARKSKIHAAQTREDLVKVAKELGYSTNWVFHVMQAREKRKRARGGA